MSFSFAFACVSRKISRNQVVRSLTATLINLGRGRIDQFAIRIECAEQPDLIGPRVGFNSPQRFGIDEKRCLHCAIVSPKPHGAPCCVIKAALIWKTKRHGLARHAAEQGIVRAVVEAANSLVVISLLVDFKTSSQEKLRGKLFDCEPDGVSRVPKSSVPNGSAPGFLLATGEQLRCGVIIEFDYGAFDRGVFVRVVFDRHLSERAFFGHDYNLLFSFDGHGTFKSLGALRSLGPPKKSRRVLESPDVSKTSRQRRPSR